MTLTQFCRIVGVEDEVVDGYGEALADINHSIIQQQNHVQRVEFYSLYDLFFSNKETRNAFRPDFVDDVIIHHPLHMSVADDAERCRKVLIAGCHIERAALRAQIDKQDPSILALYRGFSRFMLEDLSCHKRTSGLTKSKCKKLSSDVAFEMIFVRVSQLLSGGFEAYKLRLEKPGVFEHDRAPLSVPHSTIYTCVSLQAHGCEKLLMIITGTRTTDPNSASGFFQITNVDLCSRLRESHSRT